ncbi:hypothetical protein PCK2_000774 [Pneumocystis canis]|nr:hypothetical protein PCK2_000774 [Pneumocystis canis]
MDHHRDVLYQFYRPFSTILWNGNAFTGVSYAEFVKKLPNTCHEVQDFDCHPMTSSMNEHGACSIVLVVSGSVRYGHESQPRGFSDTFILKSDLEKQGTYYIASHCFRQDLKSRLDIPGFPWKELIISFIIAQYTFEQFLVFRQYKKLKEKKLPITLENIIDQETFDKSQSYGRAKAKFGIIGEFYGLIQKILIIKYNLLPNIYQLVQLGVNRFFSEKFYGEEKITYSLFFSFIFSTGALILNLPLSIYSTFVLEEKFGFNKQTPSLFIKDLLKNQILLIVIGGPLLFGFLKIIAYFGFVLYNDILTPINSILTFFINIYTRQKEYEADAFAAKLYYTKDLARALIKLHVQNLSTMDADWLYSSYHYSHPILSERLRALNYTHESKSQ